MGDTGSWSFTSTVLVQPITQAAPTSGSTTAGTAFTDHLVVTGANGAVTYTTTSATAPVTVSSSGAVIASSTVPAGTYTLTGTDTDTVGDNGTWVYSLTVSTAGPARADLSVSLAAPATVHTGSAVTVTVTNSGPGTATKVGSALLVPSGWTLTNAGGGTVIARQLDVFREPTLSTGGTVAYTLTLTAPKRGVWRRCWRSPPRPPATPTTATTPPYPYQNHLNRAQLIAL